VEVFEAGMPDARSEGGDINHTWAGDVVNGLVHQKVVDGAELQSP
jgi:hypothetical protein